MQFYCESLNSNFRHFSVYLTTVRFFNIKFGRLCLLIFNITSAQFNSRSYPQSESPGFIDLLRKCLHYSPRQSWIFEYYVSSTYRTVFKNRELFFLCLGLSKYSAWLCFYKQNSGVEGWANLFVLNTARLILKLY